MAKIRIPRFDTSRPEGMITCPVCGMAFDVFRQPDGVRRIALHNRDDRGKPRLCGGTYHPVYDGDVPSPSTADMTILPTTHAPSAAAATLANLQRAVADVTPAAPPKSLLESLDDLPRIDKIANARKAERMALAAALQDATSARELLGGVIREVLFQELERPGSKLRIVDPGYALVRVELTNSYNAIAQMLGTSDPRVMRDRVARLLTIERHALGLKDQLQAIEAREKSPVSKKDGAA